MYAYARVHERVDAALAAYSAPTLRRLEITVPYGSPHLTSDRVSSWLRFASRRLAGDLLLSLPHRVPDGDREEILIPPCQRATAIHIEHVRRTLRFLPLLPVPVAGGGLAFAALATLRIKDALVDSRELEDVLSSRCPRLKELALEYVTLRDGPAVFSISSGSLQRLEVASSDEFGGLLRVAAPELQVLTQQFISCDAYIAAPKLSQLYWYDLCYDPSRHRFAEAGRHLRRMKVTTGTPSMALMKRFDIVDELDLTLYVPQGVQQYEKLLEDTSKLAKCCEALVLRFMVVNHEFKPILVHLLQQCHGIRKLSVEFNSTMGDYPCKSWGCPCSRLENRKTNLLHSLEEVQVKGGGDEADHKAELVRMLCKCHATFKKKVSISVQGNTYTRERICRFVPPNDKYEITVSSVL
ncbi:unnamed protein product [Urochloa decumbens]|uniref:F-box/LRR-repeat protein 15/At3g58940/PEG3-like LRR domain-containing protein n=1 Tax=Urochloa decumbens TaxID=240449 RepID=A0ABC9H446_9POAL